MSNYTYKAFISYRHLPLDKKVAEKLQRMLETYKPPKELRHKKENWRIFRDETELPTSSNLSDDIKNALEKSEFLIVICSKETKNSKWCLEEIEQFKKLHGGTNENIITLLVEGNPNEVFPQELCTTKEKIIKEDGGIEYIERVVEPLAANISAWSMPLTMKKLQTEFLRVAAPLLKCGYDDLYNRGQKRRRRRFAAVAAAVFAAVTLFGIYSSVMLMKINEQNSQLMAKNEELQLKTQELNESNESLEEANSELDTANTALDNKNKELDKTNTALDETNSTLESKNAELDKSNAALTSANKKLDSSNAALTSANEKLDRSNSDLTAANKKLDNANYALTESNANLAVKTREAEDNLVEANKQRDAAEANLEEASRQKAIAEQNLAYAEEQKDLAEENLELVKEKNNELMISSANMAAKTAETDIKNNDRESAIRTILDNRPYEDDITKLLPSGINVLSKAVYAYQSDSTPQIDRYLEAAGNIKYCEYNSDFTKILAYDDEKNIYVWDIDTGQLLLQDTMNDTIKTVVFLSDNNVLAVTEKTILVMNYSDGSIERENTANDLFGQYHSISGLKLSADRSTLAVWAYDNIAFIRTQTGEVIYKEKIDTQNGTVKCGEFYDNSKFILCSYTLGFGENDKYNSKFLHYDLEKQDYTSIPYETDMYVCALSYCAGNAFSIEGCAYDENDKAVYQIKTIDMAGKERYTTLLNDFSQWFENADFRAMVWEEDNLSFLMLSSYRDLIFVDILSGEIYDRTEFKSNIKKVYRTSKNGILRILCEDGVYMLDLYEKKYRNLLSFDDEDSEATTFFLWGNRYKYAVVGKDKNSIVLYRDQQDENYTEIDVSSYRDYNVCKEGNYFTIKKGEKIYVYDSIGKKLMSEIPCSSYTYYLNKNNIIVKNQKELAWYDIYTGNLIRNINLEALDGYFSYAYGVISEPDEDSIIAYNYHKIFRVNDDIQEIFSDDTVYMTTSGSYINNDGSRMIVNAHNYNPDFNELRVIDTENGTYMILAKDKDAFLGYGKDGAAIGNTMAAVNYDKKLMIFNVYTGMLEKEIPLSDIAVKAMIFSPDERNIIIYGSNNALYQYDVDKGELTNKLSLAYNRNESTSFNITMEICEERSTLILTRGSRAWLVDLSSFEVLTEMPEYTYRGFIPSTQEFIMRSNDKTRFYPYYTSAQLIEMAENIIDKTKP